MSDRVILSLATVPMVAGVLLVGLLQRGVAHHQPVKRPPAAPVRPNDPARRAEQAWLGVVVAGQAAELASEFGGRVTRVFVRNGAHVEEGDPILQIDRDDAAAAVGVAGAEVAQKQSDVERASARVEAARQKLARLQAGGAWLSALELDGARVELRVAEAELRAARSLVQMGRARLVQQQVRDKKHTLVAPFRGTLVSIEVDRGDTVEAGRVLARVISDDRRIKFALPRDQLALEMGEVWILHDALKRPLRAQVYAVRPEVDAAAQLVFATAALPDDAVAAAWLPGTEVRVLRAAGDALAPGPET